MWTNNLSIKLGAELICCNSTKAVIIPNRVQMLKCFPEGDCWISSIQSLYMQKSRHSVRLGLVPICSWRQSEQLDDLLGSFPYTLVLLDTLFTSP